jgi:hypothetical protein
MSNPQIVNLPRRGASEALPSRGLGGRARDIMQAIEQEGFVDFRRAAEVFNGRPKGFYTAKDLTYDIRDARAIYYTLARLEERGLVAIPLRLRPREWHLVSWSGGVPSIDALKGRVVRMCTKHHPEPLLLKTKGQTWQLPNPVIRITACP